MLLYYINCFKLIEVLQIISMTPNQLKIMIFELSLALY